MFTQGFGAQAVEFDEARLLLGACGGVQRARLVGQGLGVFVLLLAAAQLAVLLVERVATFAQFVFQRLQLPLQRAQGVGLGFELPALLFQAMDLREQGPPVQRLEAVEYR